VNIQIKLLGHFFTIKANIKLNSAITLTEGIQIIKQIESFIIKTFKTSNTIITQPHSEER
jgi:divalent metal cation (Fe/Co/Zn/Cd) transporter